MGIFPILSSSSCAWMAWEFVVVVFDVSMNTYLPQIALGAGGRSGSSRKVSADVENQSQASVGSMGISSVTDLGFRGRFDQLQRRPSNSILSDVEKDRMARVQRRVFCT